MTEQNLNELSADELRTMVRRLQEQVSQKDRQITHLSRNAQKWVKKFDDHQNSVAENVIKKFEMEFEHERNELYAKLAKMSQLNKGLIERYANLEKSIKNSGMKVVKVQKKDATDLLEEAIDAEQIQVNLLQEPASITELEISGDMKEIMSKYAV